MIYKNTKFNKGYTLLFAVLVSSLVLSVGISILSVSKKEFLLSSSARESTSAIYTADSALECAVYHDNQGYFSTSSPASLLNCFGDRFNLLPPQKDFKGTGSQDDDVYTFNFHATDRRSLNETNKNACAIVTVEKSLKFTNIESRGYNIGWNDKAASMGGKDCNVPSPKKVERALYYTYSTEPN